jgi:hypothetical protein
MEPLLLLADSSMSTLRLTPVLFVYLRSWLDEGDLSTKLRGEALELEDLSIDNSPGWPSSILIGLSEDLYLDALSDVTGKSVASLEEIAFDLCSITASLYFDSSALKCL